jgi:hypothetical protein
MPKTPVVAALFAADAFATLAEAGIANSSWYQLREGGLTTNDGKLTPAYFGTQMFHIVAFRPGDALLATTGTSSSLGVHATQRQDGLFGVMLVNKEPQTRMKVKVSINGGNLAGNGLRFVYGPEQAAKGVGPDRSEVKTDGDSIVLDVPPYSIVDVILPVKK